MSRAEGTFLDTDDNNLNLAVIQWAQQALISSGYTLKRTQPDIVQDTPWSFVVRFSTAKSYVYLKQTPKSLAVETSVIELLRDQFKAPVPVIIAHDEGLNSFLMADAGLSLRQILQKNFDERLLIKAIDQFIALQGMVADKLELFLKIGVPDYRLDKLPEHYRQLLSKKEILIAGGLSEGEIAQLRKHANIVSNLCKTLSSFAIKETIVQPDFNDNNTLMNDSTKQLTIIDLGEVAISHPFFPLLNFMHVIKKHHALNETTETYQKLKSHCFKHFNMNEKDLAEATKLAQALFFVYAALGDYRLLCACDRSKFTGEFQRHARIAPSLKLFLKTCS